MGAYRAGPVCLLTCRARGGSGGGGAKPAGILSYAAGPVPAPPRPRPAAAVSLHRAQDCHVGIAGHAPRVTRSQCRAGPAAPLPQPGPTVGPPQPRSLLASPAPRLTSLAAPQRRHLRQRRRRMTRIWRRMTRIWWARVVGTGGRAGRQGAGARGDALRPRPRPPPRAAGAAPPPRHPARHVAGNHEGRGPGRPARRRIAEAVCARAHTNAIKHRTDAHRTARAHQHTNTRAHPHTHARAHTSAAPCCLERGACARGASLACRS